MSSEEQEAVFQSLAAILHMGNIEFEDSDDQQDGCVLTPAAEKEAAITAELLGVPKALLVSALTSRTRSTRDGPIRSPLNASSSRETRDTLAKVCLPCMQQRCWRHPRA